jgi:hypothetical protein
MAAEAATAAFSMAAHGCAIDFIGVFLGCAWLRFLFW